MTLLAHLRIGSVQVRAGQLVSDGQPIGEVGNSGNSTSPHLHFQIMDARDPFTAEGLPCNFASMSDSVTWRAKKPTTRYPRRSSRSERFEAASLPSWVSQPNANPRFRSHGRLASGLVPLLMSIGATVIIREATLNDIPGLVAVRGAVAENILTTDIPLERIAAALEERGRGWVAEHEGQVIGFSMADLEEAIIWALFLLPKWEGRGLGRVLLERAVEWLWVKGCQRISLTTESGSRAEGFYSHIGWSRAGVADNGEVRFELQRPPAASQVENQRHTYD